MFKFRTIWVFFFSLFFFCGRWGIQFYLCRHRPVPPPSVKGRQGGCINRSCRPIIVKMPTALCGESRRPHSSRPRWKEQTKPKKKKTKKVLQLPQLLEEKGANLTRNVLVRSDRSPSKSDNLPKNTFLELLNILLNKFVSAAFSNKKRKEKKPPLCWK